MTALRLAYADPPYLGCGQKLYGGHHADAAAWDDPAAHAELLRVLDEEYDGWAYSCNVRDLSWVLPLVPHARVAAWTKPFVAWKPRQRVAHSWEPLVFRPVRQLDAPGEPSPKVRDHYAGHPTRGRGLPGAKPEGFARWMLDLLGYRDGDGLVDMFPGTGVVTTVAAQLVLA